MSNKDGRKHNGTFYTDLYSNVNSHWWYDSNSDSGYGDSNYDFIEPKRKHKFAPILLIYTTVYNCELCGAKKEDCSSDYCNQKKSDFDIGDW